MSNDIDNVRKLDQTLGVDSVTETLKVAGTDTVTTIPGTQHGQHDGNIPGTRQNKAMVKRQAQHSANVKPIIPNSRR